MDEYPDSKTLKPGDQVLVLNNASANWIDRNKIYTVKSVTARGHLLFEESKDLGWACYSNEQNHWFKLTRIGNNPTESLLDQLDQLEQKHLKQLNHDTGRKISKSKS